MVKELGPECVKWIHSPRDWAIIEYAVHVSNTPNRNLILCAF